LNLSLWKNTMNRCLILTPLHRLLLLMAMMVGLGLGLLPQSAWSQTEMRNFPKAAKRGVLEVVAPPEIKINGKPERLSPGARIRGSNNLIVMSGTLMGKEIVVNYVRDTQGMVHDVWILNAIEAREERASESGNNIFFGADWEKPKADDGKTPFNQLPRFGQ
jgi:hypothetical protein